MRGERADRHLRQRAGVGPALRPPRPGRAAPTADSAASRKSGDGRGARCSCPAQPELVEPERVAVAAALGLHPLSARRSRGPRSPRRRPPRRRPRAAPRRRSAPSRRWWRCPRPPAPGGRRRRGPRSGAADRAPSPPCGRRTRPARGPGRRRRAASRSRPGRRPSVSPPDGVVLPVGGQLEHHPADQRRGRRVEGDPAQVDVVVGLLAGGQRDPAVHDGLPVTWSSSASRSVMAVTLASRASRLRADASGADVGRTPDRVAGMPVHHGARDQSPAWPDAASRSRRRSSPRCRRWRCARARQPRPGLPRPGRSGSVSRPRSTALRAGRNQYAPGPACPSSGRRSPRTRPRHYGIELDPATQVVVTAGATEAIAAAILALREPRRRDGRPGALLRLLRRVHRDGRRRTTPGDPARAGLPARRRRAAGRGHRRAPRRSC